MYCTRIIPFITFDGMTVEENLVPFLWGFCGIKEKQFCPGGLSQLLQGFTVYKVLNVENFCCKTDRQTNSTTIKSFFCLVVKRFLDDTVAL